MGKKKISSDLQAEITAIQEEAREGYDFRARLAGANNRRKTITVYTDAAAGDKLGYAIDAVLPGGIKTGERLRKGLVGKLDALAIEGDALLKRFDALEEAGAEIPDVDNDRVKEITAERAKLTKQIDALKERLKGTGIEFHLISLPKMIQKKVKRETRQALGLKAKGIPESRQEEYDDEYTARILSASVEKWTDHENGETSSSLSVQQAKDLEDFLPEGQFPRLDRACVELTFEAAIADGSVDDADF
ncbi:hypothetical protein [Streptomyces sp. AC495_CC817]|uniref:hypothetical protein n=1 Tax=Streptomyces sp. AC495_CC817 TaxID=2823900 RepID=UPI001C27D326|nr:hypothetical protein [Streptomyces sp. AC495_CC817]